MPLSQAQVIDCLTVLNELREAIESDTAEATRPVLRRMLKPVSGLAKQFAADLAALREAEKDELMAHLQYVAPEQEQVKP